MLYLFQIIIYSLDSGFYLPLNVNVWRETSDAENIGANRRVESHNDRFVGHEPEIMLARCVYYLGTELVVASLYHGKINRLNVKVSRELIVRVAEYKANLTVRVRCERTVSIVAAT